MDLRTLGFLVASLTACTNTSSSPPAPGLPQPTPGKVTIGLASVTLASDCGTAPTTAPVVPARAAASADQERSAGSAHAATAAELPCEQSSVQLVVSNLTPASASLEVKSVTVLDARGATVAQLQPAKPSLWSGDVYKPWDEAIPAGATLNVAYALSRPAVTAGTTYTVRVTIATAGGDTTVETQASTVQGPASVPPGVST